MSDNTDITPQNYEKLAGILDKLNKKNDDSKKNNEAQGMIRRIDKDY